MWRTVIVEGGGYSTACIHLEERHASPVTAAPFILFFAAALIAAIPVFAPSAEAADSSSPALIAPASDRPAPTVSELVRIGYLALVKRSIVPANPRVIAAAALKAGAALVPRHVRTLPSGFGADAERDAEWLAECKVDLPSAWPVLDAMARAAATAHVGLGTPQKRLGIGALMKGQPLSAPGFNLYPLADGRFVVFDVIPGASAEASGLRSGDVISRINGEPPTALDSFLIHILPAGSEVVLDFERAGRPATLVLRLRATEVPSLESRLLADGAGYVFIRWFARSGEAQLDTAALARQAFIALAAQGARGLIVDLRSSLGGSGEVKIASALCDGEIIYSTKGPLSAPAQPVKREGERCWPERPIVVLVNELTVSSGEALALTLRELGHAKIIGRTSAGGLTEMSFVPLAEGYSMTIPTGVVLGPVTGEVPSGFAIKPDLDLANPSIDELLRGHDGQLAAARALVIGR